MRRAAQLALPAGLSRIAIVSDCHVVTHHAECYHDGMIRSQIQLPEADYARLRAVAAGMNRSIADCIREGVGLFLQQRSTREDDLADLVKGFEPLPMDRPESHDSQWAEAILRSKRGGVHR